MSQKLSLTINLKQLSVSLYNSGAKRRIYKLFFTNLYVSDLRIKDLILRLMKHLLMCDLLLTFFPCILGSCLNSAQTGLRFYPVLPWKPNLTCSRSKLSHNAKRKKKTPQRDPKRRPTLYQLKCARGKHFWEAAEVQPTPLQHLHMAQYVPPVSTEAAVWINTVLIDKAAQ